MGGLQGQEGAGILAGRVGVAFRGSGVRMADEELRFREKVFYGYADFGSGIAFTVVGLYLFAYLATKTRAAGSRAQNARRGHTAQVPYV